MGFKVHFLTSQPIRRTLSSPWGRPHGVLCLYGNGASKPDDVLLALSTFPKPVPSVRAFEKYVTKPGPNHESVVGAYTGLGVPAFIAKLRVPGGGGTSTTTTGIMAVRRTHVWLATGFPPPLALPTLGKLARLALTL